jgi:hypothetical protein
MMRLLILGLGVGLASGRPWQSDSSEWFHTSALIAALLLAALLIVG